MNKFLVGFLVVLAGGVFGWYYLSGDLQSPSVSEQTSTVTETEASGTAGIDTTQEETLVVVATASVTYSDSGFAPAKVAVKKGTAVTFTNQSVGMMRAVSDVHPTHQLLPGFDQLKGEAKGATYEYVFAKAGTWTYHNHMNPSHLGTIVVTE